MSNDEDRCSFCNLELVYEILKFVRCHSTKADGVTTVSIPRPNIAELFNTSLEEFDDNCVLLAKEGCFKYAPYGTPYPMELENCNTLIYDLTLKAEFLFQDVRRILNKS